MKLEAWLPPADLAERVFAEEPGGGRPSLAWRTDPSDPGPGFACRSAGRQVEWTLGPMPPVGSYPAGTYVAKRQVALALQAEGKVLIFSRIRAEQILEQDTFPGPFAWVLERHFGGTAIEIP